MASRSSFSSGSNTASDVGTIAGTAAHDGDFLSRAASSFSEDADDGRFDGRDHSFDSVLSVDLVKVPMRLQGDEDDDDADGNTERANGIAEFRWRRGSSNGSGAGGQRRRSRTRDSSTPSRTSATQMFSPETAFLDSDFIRDDATAWETLMQAHDPMKDGVDARTASDGVKLASSYYNAGVRDMLVGSFITAIQLFTKAAFLVPQESAPLISKAECFAKLSDLKSSIFCYRRVTWILEQREKEAQDLGSGPRSSAHRRAERSERRRYNQMKALVNEAMTLPRSSSASSSSSSRPFTSTTTSGSSVHSSGANPGSRLETLQAKLCSMWCEERMNACQIRLVELLHAQSLASFNASLNDDALYYVDEALTQLAELTQRLACDTMRLSSPAALSRSHTQIRGHSANTAPGHRFSSAYSNSSSGGGGGRGGNESGSGVDLSLGGSPLESSVDDPFGSTLPGLSSVNPSARLCFENVERKLMAYERQATIHKCAFQIEGGNDGAAELSLRRFLASIFSAVSSENPTEACKHHASSISSELDLHAMLLLADIYRRRSLFPDVRQLLDQVEDTEENAWTSHPDVVDAERAFCISYDAFRAAAVSACDVRAVTRCINTYPDDALLYLARAKGYLAANRGSSQSATSSSDADTVNPKTSPARRAIRDLFVCIQKSNGGCSEAVELMTTLFLSLGSEQEDGQPDASSAVMYYSEALKWRPGNGTVLLARGDCYFKLANYPKAIEDYTTVMALKSEPQHSRDTAARRLATVHDLLGAHLLNTAATLTPYNSNNGAAKPKRGKRAPLPSPSEEKKTFLSSTGRNLTVTQFQERRKALLMEAEDEFSHAVALDDQGPTWYFHRAICRLQLGATMFALRDILSCRQLDPQHPTIRQFVAQFQETVSPPPEVFSQQAITDCLSTTLPTGFDTRTHAQDNAPSSQPPQPFPSFPSQGMDGSSYFSPQWASVSSPSYKGTTAVAASAGRSPAGTQGIHSSSPKQNWKSASYPPPPAASGRKGASGATTSHVFSRRTDALPFIGSTTTSSSNTVRSAGNTSTPKGRRNQM